MIGFFSEIQCLQLSSGVKHELFRSLQRFRGVAVATIIMFLLGKAI